KIQKNDISQFKRVWERARQNKQKKIDFLFKKNRSKYRTQRLNNSHVNNNLMCHIDAIRYPQEWKCTI
ncbi:hypothetical protein DVQ53_21315, partial [Yersinia enterocolitica]|nr:hypothetical protein [Yersinia enterocolitica]